MVQIFVCQEVKDRLTQLGFGPGTERSPSDHGKEGVRGRKGRRKRLPFRLSRKSIHGVRAKCLEETRIVMILVRLSGYAVKSKSLDRSKVLFYEYAQSSYMRFNTSILSNRFVGTFADIQFLFFFLKESSFGILPASVGVLPPGLP